MDDTSRGEPVYVLHSYSEGIYVQGKAITEHAWCCFISYRCPPFSQYPSFGIVSFCILLLTKPESFASSNKLTILAVLPCD